MKIIINNKTKYNFSKLGSALDQIITELNSNERHDYTLQIYKGNNNYDYLKACTKINKDSYTITIKEVK